jgi:hypothetical protein
MEQHVCTDGCRTKVRYNTGDEGDAFSSGEVLQFE